ncbi:MAG: toll/interleukin-1 receptor domain-containing protein [Pseudomonadales bacterium]|nr:toll/interleukin-1 receptor domain-containing protein [Pseudomonadales bacterium]
MKEKEYSAFISYSSKDETEAIGLVEKLESQGYRCWLAKRDLYHSGNDYSLVIPKIIPKCQCVVLLLTENSNHSKHVRNELDIAFEQQVPIFPMKLDETDGKQLEWFLRSYQWFDAIDRNLDDIVQAIISKLDNHDLYTPLKPDKKQLIPKRNSIIAGGISIIAIILAIQLYLNFTATPNISTTPAQPSEMAPIATNNWTPDKMTLKGTNADDYDPTFHFNLKNSNWKILVETPKQAPIGSITSLKYSFDEENWQMGYADGESLINNPPPMDSKYVYIKLKDFQREAYGPYKYPIDLQAIAEARIKSIAQEDIKPRVSFSRSRGWSIHFDPQNFYVHHFNVYLSIDGKEWIDQEGKRHIESTNFAGLNEVFVKFKNLLTDVETEVFKVTADFSQLSREEFIKNFHQRSQPSLSCRVDTCSINGTNIAAISKLHYGASKGQLDFSYKFQIPIEQLVGSRNSFKSSDFKIPSLSCGRTIYYSYELLDGSMTDIKDTFVSRWRPCEDNEQITLATQD